MNKIFISTVLACGLFLCNPLQAQVSQGGTPRTYAQRLTKSAAVIPSYTLKTWNVETLQAEDLANPSPQRYAKVEQVNIDVKQQGIKSTVTDGTIWRYSLTSDQAKSIQVIFSKYVVPAGATLFLYNDDYSQITGAFTSDNMQDDSTFVLADFKGSSLTLEYFEPSNCSFAGQLVIGRIGNAYADIDNLSAKSSEDYLNINCPQGKDYQDIKHAVCKITFQLSDGSYLCSGSLINNTNNDGTPYFLTANHCISDSATAQTVVAYFNYEVEGCNGNTLNPKSLTGAKLQTTGAESDYTLLKFNKTPPSNYRPVYAGWNAEDKADKFYVGIHHPEGYPKKLAIDSDSIYSINAELNWDEGSPTPKNSHWGLQFTTSSTAGGSSGSPLFDKNKRIVGQLHGGSSSVDYYGKLAYSWTNPDDKYKTLKSFLDPNDSKTLTLDSYIPTSNAPSAYFISPFEYVCTSASVQLKDYSVLNPTSWKWVVSPSTYTFTDGTDATSQNPVIQFDTDGTYSLTLIVKNENGTDTMTLENAVTAGSALNVGISSDASSVCYCKFDSVLFVASGANTYQWSLSGDYASFVTLSSVSGDSVYVKPVKGFTTDSTYSFQLQTIGNQGSCSASGNYSFSVFLPKNDSIVHAYTLGTGISPLFSNKCATVEANEPVPPSTSCTSQSAWCDEYGTGQNILENSVWFKLTHLSGTYSISTTGMDNQIAIYQADTESDLLNGNFTLLAANDDKSSSESDAYIKSVSLSYDATYWIQVDGSGGGTEGSFYFNIKKIKASSTDLAERESDIVVYPNPVADVLNVESDLLLNESVNLSVYSVSGTCLYSNKLSNSASSLLQINTSTWHPGVYLVKVQCVDYVKVIRFVKS
jgi:V8-like Glu-specific endopeptidase